MTTRHSRHSLPPLGPLPLPHLPSRPSAPAPQTERASPRRRGRRESPRKRSRPRRLRPVRAAPPGPARGALSSLLATPDLDGALDDVTRPSEDVLHEWLESYQSDRSRFQSTALHVEVTLRDLLQRTAGEPLPNSLRTAVCCDLLEELCADSLGRFGHILSVLKTELFRSIYVNYDEFLAGTLQQLPTSFVARPYFAHARQQQHQIAALDSQLAWYRKQHHVLEADMTQRRAVLHTSSHKWRVSLLTHVFQRWQAWSATRRSLRTRLHAVFAMASNKARAREAFHAWHKYVIRRRSRGVDGMTMPQMSELLKDTRERLFRARDQLDDLKKQLGDSEHEQQRLVSEQAESIELAVRQHRISQAQLYAKEHGAVLLEHIRDINNRIATMRLLEPHACLLPSAVKDILDGDVNDATNLEASTYHRMSVSGLAFVSGEVVDADAIETEHDTHWEGYHTFLRWANMRFHDLQRERPADVPAFDSIQDMHSSWRDGKLFILLLEALHPGLVDLHVLASPEETARTDEVLRGMRELGVDPHEAISGDELAEARPDVVYIILRQLMACDPHLRLAVPVTASGASIAEVSLHTDAERLRVLEGDIVEMVEMAGAYEDPALLEERLHSAFKRASDLCSRTEVLLDSVMRTEQRWHDFMDMTAMRARSLLLDRAKGLEVGVADPHVIRELMQFCTVKGHRLLDLMCDDEALQRSSAVVKEAHGVAEAVRRVLMPHARRLKQVYRHYAADNTDGSTGTIDKNEFFALVKQCQLMNRKSLPSVVVSRIFQVVNREETGGNDSSSDNDGDDNDGGDNPDAELVPSEFVEALVRIAHHKYRHRKDLSLDAKVRLVVNRYVLKHGMVSDPSIFRQTLLSAGVRATFKRHRRPLMRVFRYYAAGAGGKVKSGNALNNVMTINQDEFLAMLRDITVLSTSLTMSQVGRIFARIQQDDDAARRPGFLANDGNSAASTTGFEELVFTEFLEGVAAVTMHRYPDPYEPFESRLERFICTDLFGRLQEKHILRGLTKKRRKRAS